MEARIELRARHDLLHGTWHCLSAIAMLSMALTMHRGLCALEEQAGTAEGEGREGEERAAKCLVGALALLMWLLRGAESKAVLLAWVLVTCIILPFGLVSLFSVSRRVEAIWLEKRRALGAMTRRRSASAPLQNV